MLRQPLQLVGRTLADKWRIAEYVTSGGQGHLYRVTRQDHLNVEEVAKVLFDEDLTEDAQRRQRREAEVGMKLPPHPNLVVTRDRGIDANLGVRFIVMQGLRGGSLQDWLVQHGGRSPGWSASCHLLRGLAAGVAALHEAGVVHRDLNPKNIVMDRRRGTGALETPVIIDYGVARFVDEQAGLTELGVPRMVTKLWCAPEQLLDAGPDGLTVDVYSLALVFFYLITGRHPFLEGAEGLGGQRTDLEPQHGPPDFGDGFPDRLRGFLSKALSFEPDARYADAGVLASALEAAIQDHPPGPRATKNHIEGSGREPRESTTAPSAGRRWFATLTLATALALAIMLLVARWPVAPAVDSVEMQEPSEVVTGREHLCIIDVAQELFCLGRNDLGQLGSGNRESSVLARHVDVGARVRAAWAVASLSCALNDHHDLYCWGENAPNRNGDIVPFRSDPTFVTSTDGTARVAVGERAVCVADASLQWRCFGSDSDNEEAAIRRVPNALRQLAIGEGHSCGVDEQRGIWCWGESRRGQLGLGTTLSSGPGRVGPSLTFDRVVVGAEYSCGREVAKGWMCWGANDRGQLGTGFFGEDALEPSLVLEPHGAYDVLVPGGRHACASLRRSQEVMCWGENSNGALGRGTRQLELDATPAYTTPSRAFSRLASNSTGICGITNDRQILCWGNAPVVGAVDAPTLVRPSGSVAAAGGAQ